MGNIPEILLLCFYPIFCSAIVAYPGLWTGRQPDETNTGEDSILIGTPEYHYMVVETEDSHFPAIRGSNDVKDQNAGNGDRHLYFATMGHDGRFLPTNLLVGQIDPHDEQFSQILHPGLQERTHAIHAKCMESDYCRWKRKPQNLTTTISKSTGSIANLVLPFRFADHVESTRPVTPIEDLDNKLFNGQRLSVKDYFLQQSYGKLEIISEILPWVTIPYTEKECSHSQAGLSRILHTCLEAALEEAVQLLEGDGNMLHSSTTTLTFVHSGYGAEYGGNDVDGSWYEDRIWSHAWEIATPLYQGRYAVISDKYDRKNNRINRVGVAVHELAQVLGAPTIYGHFPGYGLGYFDVMANPWGFDGTLSNCGSLSPYTKHLFGWIELEEILQDGIYELEQSHTNNKVFVIQRGFPDGEFLILENRQEEGYDQGLSQPGLAIYHVDELATNVGSYPGAYNFPRDHYIVSLLQGDGRFDLERMKEEGDSGDLFHSGRFTGIGPNGVFLEDGSLSSDQQNGGNLYPNTNSYQGGEEKPSGVVITNISVPDKIMSFQVTFQ